ncbi:MAG: hypothetical protein V4449_01895 [Patescibacteria group bacterium]
MHTTLVYKTPFWKEAVIVLCALAFIGVGVLIMYAAYTDGKWIGYVIGPIGILFGVIGAVLSVSSRTVLRLDAGGVFVQPHFLSKQTISWSNIERFEKVVQTFSQKSRFGLSEHKMAYLGIYLRQPREAGVAFEVAQTVFEKIDAKNAKDPLIEKQRQGHVFITGLLLPGSIDTVLREVREYHSRMVGDSVHYELAEVLPSTKGLFKPSIYLIVAGIVTAAFLLLFLASFITGMTPEQLLNSIF